MTNTSASRRISSAMASRNASRMVMVTISVPSGTSGSGSNCGCRRLGRRRSSRAPALGVFRPALPSRRCRIPRPSAGEPLRRLRRRSLPSSSAALSSPSARIIAIGVLTATSVGAFRHQNLAERAFVDRLHLHGGFVGLDLGDHVAGFDGVAFLLQPLGEIALLHRRRQRGHEDLSRHGGLTRGQSSRLKRTARVADGKHDRFHRYTSV